MRPGAYDGVLTRQYAAPFASAPRRARDNVLEQISFNYNNHCRTSAALPRVVRERWRGKKKPSAVGRTRSYLQCIDRTFEHRGRRRTQCRVENLL